MTRRTAVLAEDAALGHVDGFEWDSATGKLTAVLLHGNGILGHEQRISIESIQRVDEEGNLLLGGSYAEFQAYLGTSSRAWTT